MIPGLVGLNNSRQKVLPPLAVLSIHKSRYLFRLYHFFYGALACSVWLALWLYIGDTKAPLIQRAAWVCLACIASGWLWYWFRRQSRAITVGLLAYLPTGSAQLEMTDPSGGLDAWMFSDAQGAKSYQLAGEVLCWPWLIILPLKTKAGEKKRLVIAADALSVADQARLRTWLRACLKPKG